MEFGKFREFSEDPGNEKSKIEMEASHLPRDREESEEPEEFGNRGRNHVKDGFSAVMRPSDLPNGDLVSLLLAATPPYLYSVPLIPQTFFFSEMLKSFVRAKADRQNLKPHQSRGRRQRKREWKEATPPISVPREGKEKRFEVTAHKPAEEEKGKMSSENPSEEGNRKCCPIGSKRVGSNNFSVEKLCSKSSVVSPEAIDGTNKPEDAVAPTPPPWYPLSYPPHPPHGCPSLDPLHFFIDLRVSARFRNGNPDADRGNEEIPLSSRPISRFRETDFPKDPSFGKPGHKSAFTVPSARKEANHFEGGTEKKSQSVHYIISRLKDIYESLCEGNGKEKEGEGGKKCRDLRALIGLELVEDYFKRGEDGEEDDGSNSQTQTYSARID